LSYEIEHGAWLTREVEMIHPSPVDVEAKNAKVMDLAMLSVFGMKTSHINQRGTQRFPTSF
jgi:hypothetical protein